MPAADELVTILGVEISKDTMAKIQTFKSGLDSVASKLKTLSLVATGFAAAAGMLVKGTMDEVAALQTLSDKSGVSTKALQEWGYAANQAGVSASAVQGDLAKLQKQMAWTGKDGEAQLNRYADRLAGMSQQKALAYGKAFGLSDDTIVLLRQGSEGVAKLRKEANDLGAIITEDQIARSEQFRVSVQKMQEAFKSLRTHLAIAMMPAMQQVTEIFTKFIVQNRAWIASKTEAFMQALVNAWAKFWDILKKVFAFFQPLVDKFKELTGEMDATEELTHVLQGVFAGLLIVFAPLIAKVAALGAAFYAASLVAEDLMYWLNGDESLIGYGLMKFAEKFPGITRLFETLRDVAKEFLTGLVEWMAPIGESLWSGFLSAMESVSQVVEKLSGQFADWINGFTERYPNIVKGFQAIADIVQNVLIVAVQKFFELLKQVWGLIGNVVEGVGTLIGKGFDKVNDLFGGFFGGSKSGLPASVPASGGGKGGMTHNDNRTNNVQITVGSPEQGQQMLAPYMGTAAQTNTPGLNAPTIN